MKVRKRATGPPENSSKCYLESGLFSVDCDLINPEARERPHIWLEKDEELHFLLVLEDGVGHDSYAQEGKDDVE